MPRYFLKRTQSRDTPRRQQGAWWFKDLRNTYFVNFMTPRLFYRGREPSVTYQCSIKCFQRTCVWSRGLKRKNALGQQSSCLRWCKFTQVSFKWFTNDPKMHCYGSGYIFYDSGFEQLKNLTNQVENYFLLFFFHSFGTYCLKWYIKVRMMTSKVLGGNWDKILWLFLRNGIHARGQFCEYSG